MKIKKTTNPIEVERPTIWSLPVIFSSPHSGASYPEPFMEQSPLPLLTLRQSEDFKVDELFSSAPLFGAPLIKASFPRAFCDVNRKAYELDPTMFLGSLPEHAITSNPRITAGLGTIPKIVSQGMHIYSNKLIYSEIQHRLQECYFPYHSILQGLLKEGIERFGSILLIDCHSMPSPPPSKTQNSLPDIILGDRFGQSMLPNQSAPIAQKLTSLGYTTHYNAPYAGGYITQHYGKPSTGVSALQIEINRSLYMDQKTITKSDGFEHLKDHLSDFIAALPQILLQKTDE